MAPNTSREWRPLIGALLGAGISFVDLFLLRLLGVQMDLAGRDVTLAVLLLFAVTFAALGYMNGKLLVARQQERHDAAMIERQLHDLERTQARMLQVEKLASIGRMAASVAHEVRNPLGVIGSSASLLEEMLADDDTDGRKAASFIRDEVERLDSFVHALLDFSKPLRNEPACHALSSVAARVEQLCAEVVARHGARLTVECDAGSGWFDEELIVRALVTLVTNGCQAVGSGGQVVLRLRQREDGIEMSVIDDGPGVAEEVRERIFEPFVTTRAGGTGLGLALAARMVEAHRAELLLGGTVEPGTVEPGPGGLGRDRCGACFRFIIPVQATREAA